MLHITMTVDIDICADDDAVNDCFSEDAKARIDDAIKKLFDYPISVEAEVLDIVIDGEEQEA